MIGDSMGAWNSSLPNNREKKSRYALKLKIVPIIVIAAVIFLCH